MGEVIGMGIDNIITEIMKIKRYYVVKAGIVMSVLSVFLSYFYSTASTAEGWDFKYYVHQVVSSNCSHFFPIIIALTATFIVGREVTDDTLKSILVVPLSYKKLFIAKMIVVFFLTLFYSICNIGFTVIANIFLDFSGMDIKAIIVGGWSILLCNFLIYIAMFPIIIINTFFNGNLVGVAVSFLYGYFGTFEGKLLNWFPVKAAMIIGDPLCGVGYEEISYRVWSAVLVLVLCFVISIILIQNLEIDKRIARKKKSKSKTYKKGW